MNVFDLKQIYPGSTLADSPSNDEAYFDYFDGVHYLYILKEQLKHQELLLLKSLMSDNKLQSEWYDFLIKGIPSSPDIEDKALCIHFNVKKVKGNQEQWLNSFQSYFDTVYDAFFLNDESGVVIVDSFRKNSEELQGFISMLDDDFSTTSSVFIGLSSHKDNLRNIFKEEQSIFNSNIINGTVINFVDVYLPYYIAPQLKDSFIGTEIKKTLESDDETIILIKSLWKNQGNLSATADELFIHRNTINYRIDKLYNEHKLNLRNIQQLLLCYLLTL